MTEHRAGDHTHSFGIELRAADGGDNELWLQGDFAFLDAENIWHQLRAHVDGAARGGSLSFEMSQVVRVDGGVMALLAHMRAELQQRGVKSEFLGAAQPLQDIIHLYRGDERSVNASAWCRWERSTSWGERRSKSCTRPGMC